MSLLVQRMIRQGLTMLAGVLATKGWLVVESTESWAAAGAEFLAALVLGASAFVWSTINARFLSKRKQ